MDLQNPVNYNIIVLGKNITFLENLLETDRKQSGGEIMKAVDIALTRNDHVSKLVNITNRYPYTILLRQGRYLVDAKSVLGVCSLQRNMPIQLEIYSDDYHTLLTDLEHMIC